MKPALKQSNPAYKTASFVKGHQLIIGLLLVFFGVGDVCFVMPNLYGTLHGFYVNWQITRFYMPLWHLTIPLLLAMALVGTLMLTVYCIRDIQAARVDNKEHAAMLVTTLGFTYLVIGCLASVDPKVPLGVAAGNRKLRKPPYTAAFRRQHHSTDSRIRFTVCSQQNLPSKPS